MELLVATALAVRRDTGAADFLFERVDLRLTAGTRLGLVGPNGSGKSTLLRLLALQAVPDDGSVARAPGVRTALLDQDAGRHLAVGPTGPAGDGVVDGRSTAPAATVWWVAGAALTEVERLESRLLAAASRSSTLGADGWATGASDYDALAAEHERLGGYAAPSRVREILSALGFGPQRHGDTVAQLSDGERQRLALAAVLTSPADVLLLDEPTNHLDLPARAWLERHLARRQGAVVIVSHDRALLDAATNSTAFLSRTGLRVVAAGYGRAAKAMTASGSLAARRMREREKESARLDKVAAELAAHGAKAQGRRHKDLRGGTAGARPRTRGLLLEAEHLSSSGVVVDATVRIDARDRIALLGPNGSGKSTLLALLAGDRPGEDPRQRLWYAPAMKLVSVDQRTRGLRAGSPVVDQGSAMLGREAARRVLAASDLPYASWSRPPEELSGGERARVGLALALARPFDLLFLDEPDNDLDLAAVEALEANLTATLAETGAGLIIATHDRRLARALAHRVWTVQDGGILAHSSVPAYLRGDVGVPAATVWRDAALEPAATETGPLVTDVQPVGQEELETERDRLLEQLSDPLGLSQREHDRVRQRLVDVEGQLMSAYDAALSPAAPRYRLVELGLTIFADRPPAAEGLGSEDVRGARLVLVAAADAEHATRELAGAERTVPWLEVLLAGEVAHLRLGTVSGTCLLPSTVVALVRAGVRLAFTVMGARSVQLFSHDDLSSTALTPVGDGWWRMSLRRFLVDEGWEPVGSQHDRAGGTGGGRTGRRSRRKAVKP